MGLIYIKNVEGGSKLGLWEMSSDSLDKADIAVNSNDEGKLISEKRVKEYYSTRLLLKEILGKNVSIQYKENGKPFLEDSETKISISHSGKYVCVLLNDKSEIGVDIQVPKSKIEKLKERFLSEIELSELPGYNLEKPLHLYWGAKEALYKHWGKDGLDIKNDLRIKPFKLEGSGMIKGLIRAKDEEKEVKLSYEIKPDYFLIYTVS